MRKILTLVITLTAVLFLVACAKEEVVDYSGVYEGYSWNGEASGVLFEEATQYIKTTLYIAKDGTIVDAAMDFQILSNGVWKSRLVTEATAEINYAVDPVAATPGANYQAGTSMFTVTTGDFMSFYAIGVSAEGTVALLMVDPITRYQYEIKLPSTFDFSQNVSVLTIGSGLLVPTRRTSGGALINPTDWATLAEKHFFNMSYWSHVVTDTGILEGISSSSSVQLMLEKFGVTFTSGVPQEMTAKTGFTGLGGWAGNYGAIRSYLIGKNALEVLSLVDWSDEKYEGSINDKNQFGVDVAAGATRTAQNSIDTYAGATVRLSRESESYQKALVAAGILKIEDVIIGRF
ncbi:MAG: hypothetical protein CVV57_00100 [Tenericutes bacterium HGW-Tenericutes-2]|jgi:hypothetical protein|nr:MAG: hypothetical protein CVV57_00100 [Tenericutes bacterium HGW-Tenericutes-2]